MFLIQDTAPQDPTVYQTNTGEVLMEYFRRIARDIPIVNLDKWCLLKSSSIQLVW